MRKTTRCKIHLTVILLTCMSVTVVFITVFSHRHVQTLTRWRLMPVWLPPCKEEVLIDDNSTSADVNATVHSLPELTLRLGATLQYGGKFYPLNCRPLSQVAILIPYRDRELHLRIFLNHMHPFLQRQNIMYGIYVVEIDNSTQFNRALLMNVGFIESLKEHNYNCIVIHDVDLLPEDYRIPYTCQETPTHLSVLTSRFYYSLPYVNYFGGVSSIPTKVFRQINGMSNMFFGWGGEDDELFHRMRQHNLTILRPSDGIARYTSLSHERDKDVNPISSCLIKTTRERSAIDGLNSVKYTLLKKEHMALYTWILIQVNSTQILEENNILFSIYSDCMTQEKNRVHFLDQLSGDSEGVESAIDDFLFNIPLII